MAVLICFFENNSMKDEKLLKKPSSVKDLALGMMSYTGASTFGPIVFLGLLGFFLDKYFDTKPFILLASICIAFAITNILIYKKISVLVKKFDELDAHEKAQKENKE